MAHFAAINYQLVQRINTGQKELISLWSLTDIKLRISNVSMRSMFVRWQ